jgi:hypothetical protein
MARDRVVSHKVVPDSDLDGRQVAPAPMEPLRSYRIFLGENARKPTIIVQLRLL